MSDDDWLALPARKVVKIEREALLVWVLIVLIAVILGLGMMARSVNEYGFIVLPFGFYLAWLLR